MGGTERFLNFNILCACVCFVIIIIFKDLKLAVYLLLTFYCECKLTDSRFVARIIIVGFAMYIPSPPVKLSTTLMTACYQQWAIAVVFKLRLIPCH